jgi:hypothetical protein
MLPSPYEHHLRFVGDSAYALTLETTGFLDVTDEHGFGSGDRYELRADKRSVIVCAQPRDGRPREIVLRVRPMGAPVWVSGTRDGQALSPLAVHIAKEDLAPAGVPFRLPEIEPPAATSRSARGRARRPKERGTPVDESEAHVLEPPSGDPPGLLLWLVPRPGRSPLPLDADTRERFRALGYVGP